ncbi:MAG: protein-methionine-sulfoxide reductase catalytic subunit MsrP [Pseudomonadota bacterium]
MLLKSKRGWEIPESKATPESVYLNRRSLLAGGAGLVAGAATLGLPKIGLAQDDPSADLYPVTRNLKYTLDRDLTSEELATTYNNFYEFGSHKQIWQNAQRLPIRPWTVTFDGMVEEEKQVDIDTLLAAMPLEERTYRHRCVEAWSMAVPWSGFALAALVDYARPLGSAKYVRMETFMDPDIASVQRQFWDPWPYVEGLTIEEATNDLAFIATGLYGKPIPKQNGAPLRLAVPWKYGFKSIKSLVRFTFTDERPVSFWEELSNRWVEESGGTRQPEYGFWANVNPEVDHPRWSQATERVLGLDERVPTLYLNGYAEFVGSLYDGLEDEPLYM